MAENKYCLVSVAIRPYGQPDTTNFQLCFLGRSEHKAAAFTREKVIPWISCEWSGYVVRKDKRGEAWNR